MMFAKRIAAFTAALVLAGSAWGTSFTFYADGVTEGAAQQGRADFDFDLAASTLTITLTNNASPTEFIASELDGLTFGLIGPGTATLVDVSATAINCTGVSNPCPAAAGSSTPFTWGLTSAGGMYSLGSGFTLGADPYQRYGIVNSNYIATGSGGLSSPSTNPLLVGPVVFRFDLSGMTSLPQFGDVTFLFGAVPNDQPGLVPEPQTLALMGIGLLSLAFFRRRRTIR